MLLQKQVVILFIHYKLFVFFVLVFQIWKTQDESKF